MVPFALLRVTLSAPYSVAFSSFANALSPATPSISVRSDPTLSRTSWS